jgi:hypothetical protein
LPQNKSKKLWAARITGGTQLQVVVLLLCYHYYYDIAISPAIGVQAKSWWRPLRVRRRTILSSVKIGYELEDHPTPPKHKKKTKKN